MANCVYSEHIIFHKLSIGESKFDTNDIIIMENPDGKNLNGWFEFYHQLEKLTMKNESYNNAEYT